MCGKIFITYSELCLTFIRFFCIFTSKLKIYFDHSMKFQISFKYKLALKQIIDNRCSYVEDHLTRKMAALTHENVFLCFQEYIPCIKFDILLLIHLNLTIS